MRVLQLIDSLRPGGAERMAVNYSNALSKRIEGSYLCCTRIEGTLKNKIVPEVGYIFLRKKSVLDFNAFFKLRVYIKKNKINIIQAHSTSFFLAVLLKISLPELQVVWHDHYGKDLIKRKVSIIKIASLFIDGIIAVNVDLENWAKENLYCKKVRYFRNFISKYNSGEKQRILKGERSYKIICLANFRPQKDHINLLKAFNLLIKKYRQVTLHLIGKVEENYYSRKIQSFIVDQNLQNKVFIYGEQENPESFLFQANLGVLSSASEGLPLALLEYGMAGIPVVATAVGQCTSVIGEHGRIVTPEDPQPLYEALLFYLENEDKSRLDALNFHNKIKNNFSEEAVVPEVIRFFEFILK